MVTPNAVELVIFIWCCALLPTFTDPKFIELELTVSDDADAALQPRRLAEQHIAFRPVLVQAQMGEVGRFAIDLRRLPRSA